jgi:hypothetical protein
MCQTGLGDSLIRFSDNIDVEISRISIRWNSDRRFFLFATAIFRTKVRQYTYVPSRPRRHSRHHRCDSDDAEHAPPSLGADGPRSQASSASCRSRGVVASDRRCEACQCVREVCATVLTGFAILRYVWTAFVSYETLQ